MSPTPDRLPPSGPGSLTIADSLTDREWEALVEIVVRRMEQRIGDELDRRGRRFTPRAF